MPPMHSRKSLEAMKRVDLQRLCKEYGVKANLKTEDLIDLLLDSQTPAPPRGLSAPKSPPRPTRRSVSVRQPSQVSGPSRTSSIIVHDIDEEGDEECEEAISEDLPEKSLLVPPPRTRKAKELQTRLGKGKPVLAGGSGPRAITASSGSSKGRQTKSSKTMKPREPTIEEEPEAPSATTALIRPDTEVSNESQLIINQPILEPTQPFRKGPPFATDQMDALTSQMSSIKSEITALQGRILEISQSQKEILVELCNLRELPSVVSSLRDEVKRLREGHPTSRPCTPQPRTEQNTSTVLSKSKNSTVTPSQSHPHPGASTSALGKRHRDSTSSIIDGVIEESEQESVPDTTLAKTVIRPDKKRAKLQMDSVEENVEGTTPGPLVGDEEESSDMVGSTFAVYRGAEEPDPPPPTNHLPEAFLVDSSPGPSAGQLRSGVPSTVPTSSASSSENQPFNFAFAPASSTPPNPMYMTSFPYPEPPQSPSPARPSLPTFSSRQQVERTDIFKEFGFPSPVRSTRNYGALTNDERGINPAALQGPSPIKRTSSSNDVAAGLGLTAHRTTSSDQSSEAPTIRRTMYGTELESDTRFGDFGVEGVASGFWLSK